MNGSNATTGPMSNKLSRHCGSRPMSLSLLEVQFDEAEVGWPLACLELWSWERGTSLDSLVASLLMRSRRIFRWKDRKAVFRTSVLASSSLTFPSALVGMNCHSLGIVQGLVGKLNLRWCTGTTSGLMRPCRACGVPGAM